MRATIRALIGAVLLALSATPLLAQSQRLIALGVGLTGDRLDATESWDSTFDYLIFRIPRPERLGIAWDIGSDTHDVTVGSGAGVAGSLRMRHVLFGPGYTWRRGRTEVTASALVGPSFNRFRLTDGSPAGFEASAGNSFMFRPDVTCWIDLGPVVGLKLSANYQITNADLTLTAGDGTERTEWNARRFRTQVGIVFGIY